MTASSGDPAATPDDRKLSAAVTDHWAAFAKTGDPSAPGGPVWPVYSPANDAVLEFGADGVHVRPAFHKASLDLVEQVATAGAGR